VSSRLKTANFGKEVLKLAKREHFIDLEQN